jgi:transcription-repair coupling factor (superfamily II helicase)
MLEDAVADLRAEGGQKSREHSRDWTPNISLGLPVLIPESYVTELPVRLGLYRRIGALTTDAESEALAAELVDRFGPMPSEVENLLATVALKRACRDAGVEKLEAGPKGMVIGFRGNHFANPAGLLAFIATRNTLLRLRPDHKLVMIRDMTVEARLAAARDVITNLQRIATQKHAA